MTDLNHNSQSGVTARRPETTGQTNLATQAKDVATGVAEQAAEQAKEVGAQLVMQAKSLVTQRQTQSADDLREVAKALRTTSQQMTANMASPLMGKAAEQIDNAAEFVRHADVTQVKTAVVSFAKREPLLFLGGAFTLGILAARFLKTSAPSITSPTPGAGRS